MSFYEFNERDTDPRVEQGSITVNSYYENPYTIDEGQLVGLSGTVAAPADWEDTTGLVDAAGPLTPFWRGVDTVPFGISTEALNVDKAQVINDKRLRAVMVAGALATPNVSNKAICTGDALIVGPEWDYNARDHLIEEKKTRLALYPVHPLVFRFGYNETLALLLGADNAGNRERFAQNYCLWFTRIPLYMARGEAATSDAGLQETAQAIGGALNLVPRHPIDIEMRHIQAAGANNAPGHRERYKRVQDIYKRWCSQNVIAMAMSDAGMKQLVTVLFRY